MSLELVQPPMRERLSGSLFALARPDRRLLTAVVAGGAVAGLALRIYVWRSAFGQYDSDEAVWGLMAKHALDGRLSAFYWGQGYGGVLEVILTGALFALLGPGWVVLRLVPIALTAVAALLVWRVGRRTIGEPAASIAAVVFWVFPAYLVWKSSRAHGFYASGLVLALLVLLLVLRLAERRSRRDSAGLGLALGLAFWQTTQVLAVALPALAWLTWRRPGVWRDAWVAAPLALVSALPWLFSNLGHDWWSFETRPEAPPYLTRLRGMANGALPMALGMRVPFSSDWLAGRLVSGLVYVGLVAALLVTAWRLRRTTVSLLAAVALVYVPVVAVSGYTFLNDEPRYLVLLMPVLVLALCLPARTAQRGVVAVALAIVLTVVTFARLDVDRYRRAADGLFVPRELAPLVEELDRLGIERVFGEYWVSYRLTFVTDERIVAADVDTTSLVERSPGVVVPEHAKESRWPPYEDDVRRAEAPAWVLRDGSRPERRWRPLLEQAGYERTAVDGFAIYHRGAAGAGR